MNAVTRAFRDHCLARLIAALALAPGCGGAVVSVAPDPGLLGPLVHEALPARIVTIDGRQWVALGIEARPVVPWEGTPADGCTEPPEHEEDRPDQPGVYFAPEGPALLVLDDVATLWGVDSEQRCAVAWEPLEERDPFAGLPDEEASSLELIEAPIDSSGVEARVDLLPLPGLESVHIGYDSVTVESEEGAVVIDRPVGARVSGDSGMYSAAIRVVGDGAGGFVAQVDSDASTLEEEDGSSAAESIGETLVWRLGMEEAAVITGMRTFSSDAGDRGDGTYRKAEDTSRAAWFVPGGLLSRETEYIDSTDETHEWLPDGDSCLRTTHFSSATTIWRFESAAANVELWSLGTSNEELGGDCPGDDDPAPGDGDDGSLE